MRIIARLNLAMLAKHPKYFVQRGTRHGRMIPGEIDGHGFARVIRREFIRRNPIAIVNQRAIMIVADHAEMFRFHVQLSRETFQRVTRFVAANRFRFRFHC